MIQAQAPVQSNKQSRGFSLIEVMIAMLLVVIVMLSLLEAVSLYVETNMKNILRDEGVRVTQDVLYNMRSRSFNNLPATGTVLAIDRSLRSGTWRYDVTLTILPVTPATNPATVSILATTNWTFPKGGSVYTHTASTTRIDQ